MPGRATNVQAGASFHGILEQFNEVLGAASQADSKPRHGWFGGRVAHDETLCLHAAAGVTFKPSGVHQIVESPATSPSTISS